MFPWLPIVVRAADDDSLSVRQLVFKISDNILNPLIMLGMAVALAYFAWTVISYVKDRNSGYVFDDKGKRSGDDGASRMFWGLVGLFIMVSAFGIMRLIKALIGSDIAIP